MKIFDPNPQLSWLFCMTHPDDEIALAAWIKRLTNQGNRVYMSWTHSNPMREKEARLVSDQLGIPQDHLYFFNAPDGRVAESIESLLPKFQSMVSEIQPDKVVSCAYEQGHIDHDATNFLVNHSYAGEVLEFPLYHTYLTRFPIINSFADPQDQAVLSLAYEEQRFKVHIAKQYPSQTIWRNLFWYEVAQVLQFKSANLRKFEKMRVQTHKDYLTPHLPEPLLSKVLQCDLWKRWHSIISSFHRS